MHQDSIILKTKLQPPRVSDIIHRERFDSIISQFKDKQLITVTAGAGYGKTTFVIDALKQLGVESVWYRMDKSDTDFITFIQYISSGVKKIYPDFGNEIFMLLNATEGANRTHDYFLKLFINDLEKINGEELFIVLDDFHLVQGSQEIMNALEFILNHLPNRIHLILSSRVAIDLPLSRLKGMREILDIDEKDLCFNISEIKRLFLENLDVLINQDQVEELYKKTNGWISGLILFYHMLKDKTETDTGHFLNNLKGSRGEIYTYLEENVFNQLSSDIQSFLIKTSIISLLNPESCDQFLGITNSKEMLRYLKENNLFTLPLDDEKESYIYHDLLKDFLKEKLKAQVNEKEAKNLHSKIAEIYEKLGENRAALDHFVRAGRMEDVSRLVGMFAFDWVNQGQVQQIRLFLKKIPDVFLKDYPWFLYLQAGFSALSGRPEEAIVDYAAALDGFRSQSLNNGLDICLTQLASTYFILGEYNKAEPLFKEILSKQEPPPVLKVICLGSLLSMTYFLGKETDSNKYMEEAMSILSKVSGEEHRIALGIFYAFSALKYTSQGQLNDALENAEKGIEVLQHLGQTRVLSLCYLILSEVYCKYGFFNKGIEKAEKIIDIIKSEGFKDRLILSGYRLLGQNYLGLGLKDKALFYVQKSLKVSSELCNLLDQALAYITLGYVYLFDNDLEAAEKIILEGMDITKKIEIASVEGRFEISLASIMNEKDEYEKAYELLHSAEKKIRHLKWDYKELFFEYTHCYIKSNQKEKAIKTLLKGLSLCEEYGFDARLFWRRKWIVPLLVEIFTKGDKQEYIRKILTKMGMEVANELSVIIEDSPTNLIKDVATNLYNELRRELAVELKIYFFGKFRLFMGKTELPVNKWKSKKALQLFKYLVYYRHHGYLSKEVLMELLWPDEDPEKSANRFHVLLASMRKDLEPNLAKGVPSAYILSNAGAYMLDIGKDGWADIEEFSQNIKYAKTSKDPDESVNSYLNAISLYQGDFLEEDLYIGWCADIRERYKEDYLYALKEVIKYYEKRKAFDQCIEYASTYLKIDKCAEEIYQVLMRCYSSRSNTAMVVKTFEKCKETIQNELNCSLSQETLDLYQALNPN